MNQSQPLTPTIPYLFPTMMKCVVHKKKKERIERNLYPTLGCQHTCRFDGLMVARHEQPLYGLPHFYPPRILVVLWIHKTFCLCPQAIPGKNRFAGLLHTLLRQRDRVCQGLSGRMDEYRVMHWRTQLNTPFCSQATGQA